MKGFPNKNSNLKLVNLNETSDNASLYEAFFTKAVLCKSKRFYLRYKCMNCSENSCSYLNNSKYREENGNEHQDKC